MPLYGKKIKFIVRETENCKISVEVLEIFRGLFERNYNVLNATRCSFVKNKI